MILHDDPPAGVSLRHVIANVGSYAYLSPKRLKPIPAGCTTFNDWKYGLEKYNFTYKANLLSTDDSRIQMRIRYLTRETRYLLGTVDPGAADKSCGATAQGDGHIERGQLFWQSITQQYPGSWINSTQTLELVQGASHGTASIWTSAEGQRALLSL